MEPEMLNELQLLCKDMQEASESGEIQSANLFKKYVAHLNSIYRQSGSGQSIADLVREWVDSGQGRFFTKQIFAELGLTSRSDKKAGDMALRRLVEKGILKECGEQRGCWRPVACTVDQIDWQSADSQDVIPLKWPLGLEQYFTLYPSNVCVIAGEKNSGKTAFMMNVVDMNPDIGLPVHYYSSEMLAQELKVRVEMFKNPKAFEQAKFFPLIFDEVVDVIDPDAINIIDYLEVEDEFWMVAKKIRKMWQKLQKGIVLVALQKDPDSRYGRGKAFSSEKARVYMTMTKKQNMTLEEIKNFKGDANPGGLVIPYQFGEHGSLKRRPMPKSAPSAPMCGSSTRIVR